MNPDTDKRDRLILPAAGFVLSASLFQSRELLDAWSRDPGAAYGLVAFVIWLLCLALSLFLGGSLRARRGWVGAGAVFLVIGTLSGISLIHHLALATSLGSFIKERRGRWLSLCAAVSWIPALGWVSHTFLGSFPGPLRLIPAFGCLILLVPLIRQIRGEKREALS